MFLISPEPVENIEARTQARTATTVRPELGLLQGLLVSHVSALQEKHTDSQRYFNNCLKYHC